MRSHSCQKLTSTVNRLRFVTLAWLAALSGCSEAGGPTPVPTVAPISAASFGSASDDWNTYAHDMARTATQLQPTGLAPANVDRLQLKWTYNNGSAAPYEASPIVSDGVVYISDANGTVSALDAATGKLKWSYKLGASSAMTAALYDGILFVGTHWQFGSLFALDPATGAKLWSQQMNGGLRGSPVAVNGTLYVPITIGDKPFCEGGGVYEFDEKTGAPQASWLTELVSPSDGGAVWGPITYDGANLYFGTGNTCRNTPVTANAIVGLSLTRQLLWNVQTAPAKDDNDVGSGVLVHDGIGYVTGKNRKLYAVNVSSGQVMWSKQIGPNAQDPADGFGAIASPTLSGSTLIVSGGDTEDPYLESVPGGSLYGLSPADGSTEWSIETRFGVTSYVALTAGLAFAELDNTINALDPATGDVLWSYKTTGDFDTASPAIVPSGLYVADASGTVYAFSIPSLSAPASKAKAVARHRWLPDSTSITTRFRPHLPARSAGLRVTDWTTPGN